MTGDDFVHCLGSVLGDRMRSKQLWAPCPLDLNPCDIYLQGIFKDKTCNDDDDDDDDNTNTNNNNNNNNNNNTITSPKRRQRNLT